MPSGDGLGRPNAQSPVCLSSRFRGHPQTPHPSSSSGALHWIILSTDVCALDGQVYNYSQCLAARVPQSHELARVGLLSREHRTRRALCRHRPALVCPVSTISLQLVSEGNCS